MNLTQLKEHFGGKKESAPPKPIPIYVAAIVDAKGNVMYDGLGTRQCSWANAVYFDIVGPLQREYRPKELAELKGMKIIYLKYIIIEMRNNGTKRDPFWHFRTVKQEQIDEWKDTPFEGDLSIIASDKSTLHCIGNINWKLVSFGPEAAKEAVRILREGFKVSSLTEIAKRQVEVKAAADRLTTLTKIVNKL